MYKLAFFLLVYLCVWNIYPQFSVEPRINLSVGFTIGTQDNLLSINLTGSSVIENSTVALELSGGVGTELFHTKYSVKENNIAINLEGYFIVGSRGKRNNLPFYSGGLPIRSQDQLEDEVHSFSGIGVGVSKSYIKGSLNHLANQRGFILYRRAHLKNVWLVRIENDFRAAFILGSGTDQGETGSLYIGYTKNENNGQSHTLGFNLLLFTPVPDYSRNPTNEINSDYLSRPVLYGCSQHNDLFLGNFFMSYQFSSAYYDQFVGVGVNSQKLGAKLQNVIHDSFGLYPRLGWDNEARNKLFFQSRSSLIY